MSHDLRKGTSYQGKIILNFFLTCVKLFCVFHLIHNSKQIKLTHTQENYTV